MKLSTNRDQRRGCVAIGLVGNLVLLLPFLTSCTDENGLSDPGQALDLPDRKPPLVTPSFMPQVLKFRVLKATTVPGEYVGAPGAQVALDTPYGQRIEQKAGQLGRVMFKGIYWTGEKAAVTAYHEGYPLVSYVNLDQDRIEALTDSQGEIRIYLEPAPRLSLLNDTVVVSGSVAGMYYKHNPYAVSLANASLDEEISTWEGVGTEPYELEIPIKRPSILLAREFLDVDLPLGRGFWRPILNVMEEAIDPRSQEVSDVVLDLQAGWVDTLAAHLQVNLPDRPDSPARSGALPTCGVCENHATNCHGWSTYLELAPDHAQFALTLRWVLSDWAQHVFWYCKVENLSSVTANAVARYPDPDAAPTQLMDIPRWALPSNLFVPHPLEVPFVWFFDEPVSAAAIALYSKPKRVDGREVPAPLLWYVDVGPDSYTARIPEPPAGLSKVEVLGMEAQAQVLGGHFGAYGLEYHQGRMWSRYAKSLKVTVLP